MKEQLLLLSILAFVLFAFANGNTPGTALAFAGLTMPGKTWAANLYEQVNLLFDKDPLQEIKDLLSKNKTELEDQVKGFKKEQDEAVQKKASQDEFEALKKSHEEGVKKFQDQIDDLIEKSDKLPEQAEPKRKSLMGHIEDALVKGRDELKAKNLTLKDMWNAGSPQAKEFNIDLKAVSNMTEGYALTGLNNNLLRGMEMEPGVAKDPTTPIFITDLISVGATTNPTVYWTERVLLEGGAAQTAEAARFAQISAKYQKMNATAKKTAAYMKVSEESVEDIDFILSEMQDELINGPASIRVQLENQVLTGDGTGENHKGLFTLAPNFVLPAGFQTIANPSRFDVIEAIILQGAKANFNYDYVLLNPSDVTNMKLTKDKNDNYIIPPFMVGGMQFGATKVMANNRIAEGAILAGEMKRAKLFINRQLTIKYFDQNEDDGLNDLRTITGSIRGIFRVKGPDLKAFAKSTFTAATALIKTP